MGWRAPETLALAFPEAVLRPMTGAVELRLAEAAIAPVSRPERASEVLVALYETLGGERVTAPLVRRLPSGARAWLLCRAAALLGRESGWFQADCSACGAPYDLRLRLAEVPKGPPGPGFPITEVETSLGPRRFEVPNGRHEEVLARGTTADPRRDLVALLGLAGTAAEDACRFTEADLDRIEAALDAVAPDIGDEIATTCPACGAATRAVIDALAFALPRPDEILRETHLIARAYHWDEGAIHALPASRRRAYAQLIAAEMRGTGGAR
ncbi:hypothetical protein LAZ29_19375 [Cereibacter sphaeroides]|uniref:hypothetical protein n=1 Tax=Cereibacter sphaeroides TaxID=1063 RepID=UPI001F1E7197|nr:hypothetical protein [Cereibacter sphaeroides]MCE6953092.1 hypothetical protein [Cereibacter sphaeroides]